MRLALAAVGLCAVATVMAYSESQAESPVRVPAPALVIANKAPTETAYFAGGCFWGVEAVFDRVKGVRMAQSGYAGGALKNPDYEAVSTGATGHAETVKVVFDPRQVSYATLMQIYFSVATDPTQLNRQGPDTGTQYRGAMFPTSPAQAQQARAYIAQLTKARTYPRRIVTRIEPFNGFTVAEAYHQDYLVRHPAQPYIVINDQPKVAALKRYFPQYWKA
ncbi:peptide-methionine (S)-S-oxide reductase MsrA [Sphingomonas jaspsi]|uniref:peptide-methionine (S)-S-oxide reductase MsrA n=1 Tax=Sphingomonas jaspsi TaxID=392409 RepID=UPI0004B062E2|nr:peptide-methionine (S)-S-oxide reductase MsrA [Sphingomonas jaspsi]